MNRTAPTTTLVVTQPTDYSRLEARFKVLRYELPEKLRWRNQSSDYGRMQNSLRDQIPYPYKTFKFDMLDGKRKWVVYVLVPRGSEPQSLVLSFLSDTPLPWREVAFSHLELHVLLKLLQIAYFRGEDAGRFVGQDHCYVYARQMKEHRSYVCLQIELQGDLQNQAGAATQEFKVVGSARPFKRVDEPRQNGRAYFARQVRGEKAYFVHLRTGEVTTSVQRNEPVYEIRTYEGHRTTLSYHDQEHLDESVGKLLADFLGAYMPYLAEYGIISHLKERHFTRFDPPKDQAQLPLMLLNPIAVYDNRLRKDVPLPSYFEAFSTALPATQFVAIADLTEGAAGGVLVIQDCNKADFEDEGVLEGWTDPYNTLYQRYPHIPKQSINVNPHDGGNTTADEYLSYPPPQAVDDTLRHKLEMALYQLYLKEVVLHERGAQERLPLAPQQAVFIRKGRSNSEVYETMLYFAGDHLRFVDLRHEQGRRERNNLLSALGISWDEMYERMFMKHHPKSEEQDVKDLLAYDVIVGPGSFIEVENMNERVLYNYEEMERRQVELSAQIPLEDLKLAGRYNQVRQAATLSLEALQQRGLLSGEILPKTKKEQDSLLLYQRLQRYDDLLDEVRQTRMTISYLELTEGELMVRIGNIFALQPDAHGQYRRSAFKGYYQRLGLFLSDKGSDVQMYQGIWYDQEGCYMVGAPLPLKQSQPRAHLIRRFDVYQGADQFDIQPLLAMTSVTFVRLNQYTVSPYPFHLIDLYVETVLRYRQI